MNRLKAIAALTGSIALIFFTGCDIFNPEDNDGEEAPDVALSIVSTLTAADYSEGNTGVYDIDEETAYTNQMAIDSDNHIKTFDGTVFILERTQCDIIKITGSAITEANIDEEEHIGNATNIHDIAFISATKAYVTQYGATDVVIYNPRTGEATSETISLADYTPADGSTPGMDAAVYCDGMVYVALQKLDDNWSPTDNSSVVAIDAGTDKVEDEIVLEGKNPQGMSLFEEKLYVACTGSYGTQDGGIEVIDLSTGDTEGVLVDESDLEGDVSNVIVISATRGYVIVAGADWSNSVVPFNPTTGSVGKPLDDVDNAAAFGLAYDGTNLYVGDRSATDPGLLVIDPDDNSVISGPHDLGMPPNAIALLEVEE